MSPEGCGFDFKCVIWYALWLLPRVFPMIILGMDSANESWRYIVTSSLIARAPYTEWFFISCAIAFSSKVQDPTTCNNRSVYTRVTNGSAPSSHRAYLNYCWLWSMPWMIHRYGPFRHVASLRHDELMIHYDDDIMSAMVSPINSLTIV